MLISLVFYQSEDDRAPRVVVGAFKDQDKAQKLVNEYQDEGRDAWVIGMILED